MKWITVLALMACLPLASSALTVNTTFVNNTTDNDSQVTGNATTSASAIGSASSELTAAGTSTADVGAKFVGANSARGTITDANIVPTITQNIDATVTWTILAEDWERYSFDVTSSFNALLNIEDGSNEEPEDNVSFSALNATFLLNGEAYGNDLGLNGGSRSGVGSSTIGDVASAPLINIFGSNTFSLTYTGTASVTWKTGNTIAGNRTADALLWGMDGTMNGDAAFTDGFDNYASSADRIADGLSVDGVITLDAVPEPATAGLLTISGLLIAAYRRFFGRV